MARLVAVLVLVFTALTGLFSCADALESTIAPVSSSASAGAPDSTIGAIDDDSAPSAGGIVQAAPVGGPVPPGVFSPDAPASSPSNNGATALEVSAVAGAAAAVAGYFF